MKNKEFKVGDKVHCLMMGEDGEVGLPAKVDQRVFVNFSQSSLDYYADGRYMEDGRQVLFHKGEEPKVLYKRNLDAPQKEFKVEDKVYCFLRNKIGIIARIDTDADFEVWVELDNNDTESYTLQGSPWRDSVQTLFHYDDVEAFIGDKATTEALIEAERYYGAILRSIRFKQSMLYTS